MNKSIIDRERIVTWHSKEESKEGIEVNIQISKNESH